MANLGINPVTVAAALWIQQREQERQAQLTRSLIGLQAAEAATQARAQAARDRAQAARDRATNDDLRKLIHLQCVALAHSTGSHDERGRPNARCATCDTQLQHDECCTTSDLVFAEGESNESAGMHARAAACFTRALDLIDPDAEPAQSIDPAKVLRRSAQALDSLGLKDDALADYTTAIALNPANVSALADRADLLEKTGHVEEALADYTAALALDPSRGSVLEARARLHEKRGNVTEARADWAAALAEAPTAVSWGEHANRLGRAMDHGSWDFALDQIGQMALLEPPGNAQRSYFRDFTARVIEAVLRRAEGERGEGWLEA